MAHYVCVTGGRDNDDEASVRDVLEFLHRFYGPELRVMHGAARGIDRIAGRIAEELGVKTKAFAADWGRHPKAAGPIRNQEMVDYLKWCRSKGHTVQVVAFRGGTGTADMIGRAESAGIDVDLVDS